MNLTTKIKSSVDGELQVSSSDEQVEVSTGATGSATRQEDISERVEEYPARILDVQDCEFEYPPAISWTLKKLKNRKNLNDDQESRLYRCLVGFNNIQGICEASNQVQAKNGAAMDLLGKLSKEFSNQGRLPTKGLSILFSMIDEHLLQDTCSMGSSIHVGAEQCSKDESLYRGVHTHELHFYDSSIT